ncbi:TPA: type IV secretory system conjugative DNA transfer family protein [Campylobacter jejuni]|uniref:type IV secretory system conjugative DNA transfer family protein n=2 Tax=Campylobacter jejuni TaxID=197 RepID=UPI000C282029|nr:type IV secretory system conjugative DNA transfer family protein [Campylobacter jejuni]EAL1345174.1 type IV secretory system conjugative DNA transfer family protein [Campylobacter coli]EAH7812211.1 type IV secretory system conjugative DNA transfer family protein [Campylobacter jejuni]EAH8174197.1 type IV secretory system conjugative DNA transfer family protein [Campylobacter jejuni]EAI2376624.1 type IV secretory system conjugative DNA transfer family protein [Campylobacter jejuni]EAI3454956
MNDKKITPAKWVLMFITSIILGIILYLLMVKIIFKPDLLVTHQVGLQILHNLGNPALKLKAYVAVFALILPFIVCLIWFFMPQMNLKENYGNARFAKEKDFEEMNICNDRGLILGCNIKKRIIRRDEIKYIRAKMPLSALVVAPPGTGKTSGIILPNLFTVPNSTLALDIKGELYEKSAGYRKKYFNNEILLFEPFSDNNTLFFNPFDNSIVKDMNFIQMMKLADQIAGTIFVAEKGKEGDHWVTSAKTLFTFFALYNMQKHKHTSLGDLTQAPKKDYFNELNEEFGKECLIEDEDTGEVSRDYNVDTFKVFLKQVANDENLDEIVRNQARAYQTAAEQEFASIKSTYDTYMKVFTNPQVANATSKMNFRFEDLREKRITMYVVIQTEDMDILAPLVRIFIESLFKKLMSGQENSNPDKFIYCLLDEFVRFGKMPFLLEAPALCRSYGLIPVFVTQSYEQIRKYYGEDDLGIIRANAGYQTIFRMNTEKDAKEISDLIGDFTREKTSSSKGTFDFFKSNNTVSKEGYKLITSQYIKNQSREDILILVTGFLSRPIKAKVPYWFKNPKFKGADKISLEDNNTNTKGESKNDEINNDDSQNVNQEQNFTQENSSSKQIFELEELGIKVKKE